MPTHDLAIVEVGRHQCGYNPSFIHDVAALRYGADHVEVLLDDHDRNIVAAIEIDNRAGNVLHDRRLKSDPPRT